MMQKVLEKSAHTLASFIILFVYISCVAQANATDHQAVDVPEVEKSTISLTTEEKSWNKNKWSSTSGSESSSQIVLSPEEQAWLKAHPHIQLGAPTSYPPLVIKNAKGPHTGMLVDLFKLISRRLNTNIQLHIEDSWPSILEKAQNRTIDGLASGGHSTSREEYLNPTDTLFSTYYYVFARTNDQLHVKSVNDLEGMRIGYQRADTPVESLLGKYTGVTPPIPYTDNAAMTKGLMNKEVDVLVAWISYDYWRRDKLQGAVDNILLATDTPLDMYIHIRKDWPELIPILNKALASIRENELPKIMDKWFVQRSRLPVTLNTHLTKREQAWLAKNQTIRVRVTDFPPYIIPKKDADPEGIAIDYLKLIAERTGVKFEYDTSSKTFPDALDGLKNRQGPDVISTMVSTAERRQYILFSEEYFKSPYMFFTRLNDKQIFRGIDDFAGKKIALPKGTVLHKMIKKDYPAVHVIPYDSDINAIEAVSSGEADAYIGNMTLTAYLLLNRGPYNLKIAAPSPFGDHRFSMGIRKDWPELVGIVNKGLATITIKEQDAIHNRYISVRYDHHISTLILRWTLFVITSASGVIILFFFWNRSLKKQVAKRTSELKSSEENYRNLFENMAQGAFYQSSDGCLLGVNSAALEIFGLTYDQFVGKTSKDPQWNVIREDGSHFPGEEHPSMIALKTGKPCRDVVAGIFHVNRNAYNWVTINAVPQFQKNQDKPYQVFVTMHDITSRKQSEDLLRIQHDLAYKLSEVNSFEKGLEICLNSSLTASSMDAGGIYLLNEKTGGVDLVYHKGLPEYFVAKVSHFEADSEHVNLLKKKTPIYTEYEKLDLPPKEVEKSVDFKVICIIPILYQDLLIGCINLASPNVKKVAVFSRVAIETIASQIGNWVNYNRTKKTLHESERRFSLAMEAAQDGMYDWNLIKNTIYYSPGWKRMLGYKELELPNDFSIWEKLTDPQDVQRAWQMQRELITKKRDRFELEFKMKHKDGHWVDILSRATAIFDDTGTAVRIVGTHVDITERNKVEEERKKLTAQLHQSQKMESIGTLAGGIAHDFNNILSSVLGFTELALDAVEKETPIREDLQEVYTAGLRAKDLVQQILTFARKSDEKLKPIQVDFTINEVLKFIRSSIPTSVEIKHNIASSSYIIGSTTQIHRIMMNLCTNAAHAMEDQGGILEVTLKDITIKTTPRRERYLKRSNYIEITVSDTGVGIDPQIIDKIFEPYFTTKKQGEGTGMGLAMVHGIVESYGGEIFVESRLSKGTIFTIYLPIAKASTAHQQYKAEELPTGKERILFVDDEAQIANMASRILGQLGYSIITKTDSIDALELFRSKPHDFDLVISDVTMPKMTGDQLYNELIQIRPDIPVILCTGYSKKISEKKASEIGIKAFAYKPIVKEDLATKVRKVLDEAKNKSEV